MACYSHSAGQYRSTENVMNNFCSLVIIPPETIYFFLFVALSIAVVSALSLKILKIQGGRGRAPNRPP